MYTPHGKLSNHCYIYKSGEQVRAKDVIKFNNMIYTVASGKGGPQNDPQVLITSSEKQIITQVSKITLLCNAPIASCNCIYHSNLKQFPVNSKSLFPKVVQAPQVVEEKSSNQSATENLVAEFSKLFVGDKIQVLSDIQRFFPYRPIESQYDFLSIDSIIFFLFEKNQWKEGLLNELRKFDEFVGIAIKCKPTKSIHFFGKSRKIKKEILQLVFPFHFGKLEESSPPFVPISAIKSQCDRLVQKFNSNNVPFSMTRERIYLDNWDFYLIEKIWDNLDCISFSKENKYWDMQEHAGEPIINQPLNAPKGTLSFYFSSINGVEQYGITAKHIFSIQGHTFFVQNSPVEPTLHGFEDIMVVSIKKAEYDTFSNHLGDLNLSLPSVDTDYQILPNQVFKYGAVTNQIILIDIKFWLYSGFVNRGGAELNGTYVQNQLIATSPNPDIPVSEGGDSGGPWFMKIAENNCDIIGIHRAVVYPVDPHSILPQEGAIMASSLQLFIPEIEPIFPQIIMN